MGDQLEQSRALVLVKVLHTAVWFLYAACIVAIPVVVLSGLVWMECLVWGGVFGVAVVGQLLGMMCVLVITYMLVLFSDRGS